MFERAYKSRYHYIKAIQYDGTAEMVYDLMNEYLGLYEYGNRLYLNNTDDTEVSVMDWLLIEDNRVVAVVTDDNFHEVYISITPDEYYYGHSVGFLVNKPAKGIITDTDLKEIDEANEEKNNS